jgi:flagellar hook-associated protein 2
MTGTTSSTSGVVFGGNSRYAADFQAIIDRSVAIASLPISQLNTDKAALEAESTALQAVEDRFSSLRAAVDSINSALGASAYQATQTDPSVASVSVGAGAMEGSYSVEVVAMGSYTTAISADLNINAPGTQGLGNGTAVTLRAGGVDYALTPDDGSLTALARAINAETGAHVRAVIVNVGSAEDPDYRLSLESTKLGPVEIRVLDGETDLVAVQTTGALAEYRVNGVAVAAQSDTRTVSIAPGLSVTLLDTGSTGMTVTRQSSALSEALAGFAGAYNEAVDELDLHRGEGEGALKGRQAIYALAQSLRELAGHSEPGGPISSLTSLGLAFDINGRLNFDPLTFMGADLANSTSVAAFLGGTTTSGFLKAADTVLDAVEDPLSGRLASEIAAARTGVFQFDARIADEQARVDDLKVRLQEQMAAADALIAAMEQQYQYLFGMLDAMRAAAEQY